MSGIPRATPSSWRIDWATSRSRTSGLGRSVDMTGAAGSYRYMAPEVYLHQPYSSKVDVYAFAMICFELFEGRTPFGRIVDAKVAAEKASRGERPTWGKVNRWGKSVPQELKTLVEECWHPEADKRPHFIDIAPRLAAVVGQLPHDPGRSGKGAKCPVQ
eukprot:jgi/Botrbrau1/20700/Bobra.0058s0029.1